MLWIIWNGIEETFAKPKWLANKCGFSEPTGLLVPARLRAGTAKRPKSLPMATTKGNGMPLVRGQPVLMCAAYFAARVVQTYSISSSQEMHISRTPSLVALTVQAQDGQSSL